MLSWSAYSFYVTVPRQPVGWYFDQSVRTSGPIALHKEQYPWQSESFMASAWTKRVRGILIHIYMRLQTQAIISEHLVAASDR